VSTTITIINCFTVPRDDMVSITDRILIFNERHLRNVLDRYAAHYNGRRPHRALQLRPPRPAHPVLDLGRQRIRRRPALGGLINEYEHAA
jgi:putative transposase